MPAKAQPERNQPCPCGSGKRFKHCCARKQAAHDYEAKKRESEAKLAATPPPPSGNCKELPISDQISSSLKAIELTLKETHVESIFKLADNVVQELNIKPSFSYGQLADALDGDDRFEIAKRQLVCLAGGDPVKLYVKRLGF